MWSSREEILVEGCLKFLERFDHVLAKDEAWLGCGRSRAQDTSAE